VQSSLEGVRNGGFSGTGQAVKPENPAALPEKALLVAMDGAIRIWSAGFPASMDNIEWQTLFSIRTGPFTLGELAFSFAIVLLTVILRSLVTRVVFSGLKKAASKTRFAYDDRLIDALEKPVSSFLLLLGLFLAAGVLPVDPAWRELLTTGFRVLSVVILFWALFRLSDVLVDIMTRLSARTGSDSFRGFGDLVKKSLRVFIALVGAVMVIDNLGYNIGGLIATLGIGGAAFAFAAKDTIANFYGSIALALDRPFRVGDWIKVGDQVDGDVEEIGLRSTKVRTFPKTVVSIPNAVLANEVIDNQTRMPKRRVKQVVGVTYETSPDTMEALTAAIRKLLEDDEGVHNEFILVNWTDFGGSSLDILVYYFTATVKWAEYLAVRQRINVKIARAVADHGSSVAFPTRTLYLEGDVARQLAGGRDLPDDHGPQQPS
jgi:MscS family membrane protein